MKLYKKMISIYNTVLQNIEYKYTDLKCAVKAFINPCNVIKLKKLDKQFQETDTLMEEVLMQLLDEFFEIQQPLHGLNSVTKTKTPISVSEHLELLEKVYGPAAIVKECEDIPHEATAFAKYATETYEIYEKMLFVLNWYRNGGLNVRGAQVYMAAVNSGQTHETALALEKEHEQQITNMLVFIVQHRHKLWT